MRTSTKRSIQQVINDERLAKQAKIDKFAKGDLEIVEVKAEPINKNKRADDLKFNYIDIGKTLLGWVLVFTSIAFAALIMGNK